jgi:O-antigen ligase
MRQWINHQFIGLLSLTLILIGLLLSNAAMSIGMIGLTVNTIFNKDFVLIFKRFIRHPALWGLSGIFILYAISGLYSENIPFLIDRLRMKLPFLLLPLTILSIPVFHKQLYYKLLYLFFILVVIGCLYSVVLFLQDPWEIMERYKQGQVLPTPVMHIRFSLMVAYAVGIGWYLYQERFFLRYTWEPLAMLVLTALLVAYLHLLAVRSGLVVLYSVLLFLLIWAVGRHRRYWLGVVAGSGLLLVGWLAIRFVPSLQNKLDYTRYGLYLFQHRTNLEELSDSYRLGSVLAGADIVRKHPWTGVGVGDIREACEDYYRLHLPALYGRGLMPHNQYLFVAAATGLLGLCYFIWATIYPLLYKKSYNNPLIVIFHIIMLLSFIPEHTLETQLGTAIYILFVILGIRFQDTVMENRAT